MATHSSILVWRSPHGKRRLAGYSAWGCKELDVTERLSTAHTNASQPGYTELDLTGFQSLSNTEGVLLSCRESWLSRVQTSLLVSRLMFAKTKNKT